MASQAERAMNTLYAGLAPLERARLLARHHREHDGRSIERLRTNIPNDAAGAAYNRAIRTLRQLHGSTPPMLLAIGFAIDRDCWMLRAIVQHAIRRSRARCQLRHVWRLVGFPVTTAEHRRVVELERSELETLDGYAEWLAEFQGDEAGLQSDVSVMLTNLPPEARREFREFGEWDDVSLNAERLAEDNQRADLIARRIRRLMGSAIKQGTLPKPVRTKHGMSLPHGVLKDWGEGMTAESYKPLPPGYHVPALELFGGDCAEWDIHPDSEQAFVAARRLQLLQLCREIAEDVGRLDGVDVDGVTFDPPQTLAHSERGYEPAPLAVPWDHGSDRERMAALASVHATRRAEATAYDETIEAIQATDFGGEDPLDPAVRRLLDGMKAAQREFQELWDELVDALAPYPFEEAGTWPPSLDNVAYLADLRQELPGHLRGDFDA